MKEEFLRIQDNHNLAAFFGMNYAKLSRIIYPSNPSGKYYEFSIPKKRGGLRVIHTPNDDLRRLQNRLKNVLSEIYNIKPQVHGFVLKKSIVTNAKSHLNKRFIFNIDLKDFFGSIHFGRVRGLFMSEPFGFPKEVATVLAHLCCFNNVLPQGAPTSPILSNMISRKMDVQLLELAKKCRATYTRYADDLTFSFTCSQRMLPKQIVILDNSIVAPGVELSEIIHQNKFVIQPEKIRLSGITQRQEVTGITVNILPNMPRKYVQQIKSMLYSWEKFGYELAERTFLEKYDFSSRTRMSVKPFTHAVRGKIVFLKSVLGEENSIYRTLVSRFNLLVSEADFKIQLPEILIQKLSTKSALWVIESVHGQGTGFELHGFGIVTCAHVVGSLEHRTLYPDVEAFRGAAHRKTFRIKVEKICYHRDLALVRLLDESGESELLFPLRVSEKEAQARMSLIAYGFPEYAPGRNPTELEVQITSTQTAHAVRILNVNHSFVEGHSGGPVVDADGAVIGVVAKGNVATDNRNFAVHISEFLALMSET
jgi:RNA-directed DNA polymerase